MLRQQRGLRCLLLMDAAGATGGGKGRNARPRFLTRRAALEERGNTAGHRWIPQGGVGKQSLVWVFLSSLEKCFPRTTGSTGWSGTDTDLLTGLECSCFVCSSTCCGRT